MSLQDFKRSVLALGFWEIINNYCGGLNEIIC